MSKRTKTISSRCSLQNCPAFQNEELRKTYCGTNGLCEKLENCEKVQSDGEILFLYRKM